jgi:DNA-binding transcriptional ArsR family regulator
MAFSKAHRFSASDYHYALLCKALSHPARITIVRKLHDNGTCSVKTLMEGIKISKPSMSQHLKILREMQILKCQQKFPTVIYWLNTDLPNTYNTVIDILTHAGVKFDADHSGEIATVSRLLRATTEGL